MLVVLIYRCISAVYCFCWLIAGSVHPTNGDAKWFIYLSNWAYLFLTIYFIYSSILTAIYYRGEWMVGEYDVQDNDVLRPKSRSRLGEIEQPAEENEEARFENPLDMRIDEPVCWYHETLWVIYNIAATNAVAVTLYYIIIGYPKSLTSYTPDGLDISTHVLNSIFVLADTSLSRVPVRIYHVIYPMLFFVVYVMFCVMYWAGDGLNTYGYTYIYSWLDFTNKPGVATAFIFGYTFVALMLAQLALFGISKLRVFISNRLKLRQKAKRHSTLDPET